MRTLGYCRVSGAEQGRHGTSLDAQRAELVAYARAHRLPAPALYVEVESGSAERLERRVELARLLAAARPGDVVLVAAVDRWSRDIVHGVQSVRDLVARGVGWRALREGIDASTPQGDSTLGIMAWAADQERQRIKARTVGRRRELRDQGAYADGLVPLGYVRGPERRLVVEPVGAALVREAFARCAAGASTRDLGAWLREADPRGRTWSAGGVRALLRSRTFLGEVRDTRGVWRAAHEPIVSRSAWDAAQRGLASRRLGGRPPSTPRTEGWLLRGLASCALCGARMGPAYSPGRRQGRVELHYYACAARLARRGCEAAYVRVEPADAAVAALTLARLGELRDALARDRRAPQRDAVDRVPARAKLDARRARILDALEAGTLTPAEARQRLDRIEREREALDVADAAEARALAAASPRVRRAILADVRALAVLWGEGTRAEQREILCRLAARVALCAGAAPVVEWRDAGELAAPDL